MPRQIPHWREASLDNVHTQYFWEALGARIDHEADADRRALGSYPYLNAQDHRRIAGFSYCREPLPSVTWNHLPGILAALHQLRLPIQLQFGGADFVAQYVGLDARQQPLVVVVTAPTVVLAVGRLILGLVHHGVLPYADPRQYPWRRDG